MRIAIIGSGYVGLVAAACFAELEHSVICVDNDERKIAALRCGEIPIHEEFLPELLERHRQQRLTFSASVSEAVSASEVIFIAVGTPPMENGEADLSYVEAVSREVAGAITGYKLIVEKSTVPVYTSNWIRRIIAWSGTPQASFDVASNPEFLREGTAVTDFLYPDRIVAGVRNDHSAAIMKEIYRPLTAGSYYTRPDRIPQPDAVRTSPPLIITSPESAELIKHASNAFLAMKISFINAVAGVCECVGADVEEVCKGLRSDSRIGERFLSPGIGYGGSCFPKDLRAFQAVTRECGCDLHLLEEVIRINNEQRHRFLGKIRRALWTLRGKRLAVLGLAFKGGTDDVRESPAIALVRDLLKEGCEIVAHDPAATERAREELAGEEVVYAESAYEASEGADALLILTPWEEFAELDLHRLKQALKYPIIIDGRNLYDPCVVTAHGFRYFSVGRQDAFPQQVIRVRPRTKLKKAS